MAKDNDGDVDGAEDGELVRLLEQTAFALEEGDASIAVVANCAGWSARRHGLYCRHGERILQAHILGLISILRLPIVMAR